MQHPAWLLILLGVVIVGIGAIWLWAPSISRLGKLPSDIRIGGEDFKSYFPVVTCIVVSVLLTGIMGLVRYFSG